MPRDEDVVLTLASGLPAHVGKGRAFPEPPKTGKGEDEDERLCTTVERSETM